MAANTGIANPWEGATAPKIKPSPIEKTWRNDQDPTRRRATFGVTYPLWEITIEKSADLHTNLPARSERTKRRSIKGVRLHLGGRSLIFSDTDFDECKFHRPNEGGESKVSGIKFKSCNFERCMLGGTVFRHVSFEECEFFRCDFGGSEFKECQFIDCTFTDCTAENTSFDATEVDPSAFLRGMPPPLYNYNSSIPAGEDSPAQVAADWVEARRKVAAQLLRSNTDIQHRDNSDRGLFELKRAEIKARRQTLLKQPLKSVGRLPFRLAALFAEWVVLKATRGGTSLSRPMLGATIFVPLYALLLSFSHVTFMGQDCHVNSFHSFHLWAVLQQLSRAASLFLAFGYTSFSGGTVATVFLTAAASLGLLWYALVAEVVIHRVYR